MVDKADYFNSFMTKVPIIYKPVHWFAEQYRDYRHERVVWLYDMLNINFHDMLDCFTEKVTFSLTKNIDVFCKFCKILCTCNFIKKRLWHRCFPVNFAKFPRTPFLKEHLRATASEHKYFPVNLTKFSRTFFMKNLQQLTF